MLVLRVAYYYLASEIVGYDNDTYLFGFSENCKIVILSFLYILYI